MASMRPSLFFRLKIKLLPFLYKKCPAGNYHFFTDTLCFCRVNEYSYDWNGQVLDMITGVRYKEYKHDKR
jgi:hypothetical protein